MKRAPLFGIPAWLGYVYGCSLLAAAAVTVRASILQHGWIGILSVWEFWWDEPGQMSRLYGMGDWRLGSIILVHLVLSAVLAVLVLRWRSLAKHSGLETVQSARSRSQPDNASGGHASVKSSNDAMLDDSGMRAVTSRISQNANRGNSLNAVRRKTDRS